MAKKTVSKLGKQSVPQIDLKGDDFIHAVPEEHNMEIIIHWKGQGYKPEFINPVKAFSKQGGKLKIINRNLPDTCYTFDVKEVQRAFIVPMGE